jgi:hypothetical protein
LSGGGAHPFAVGVLASSATPPKIKKKYQSSSTSTFKLLARA